MRILLLAMAASLGASALAQTATTITSPNGSRFVVSSGSYTGAPTLGVLGSANFFPGTGTLDYNFRYAFAYRQTGDTREFAVSAAAGATFSNTTDTWTGVIPRNVMNTGANTLEFTVHHHIVNLTPTTPLLISTVKVRNLTDVRRGVVLFHYSDFDVPTFTTASATNRISSNIVSGTGIMTRQENSVEAASYAETIAFGATRFRHGPLYSTLFSNTLIDDLNNTTVVPTLTGDYAMGFQWAERFLDGGASTSYVVMSSLNSPVPEPATIAALGLGAALLIRRRRKSA